MTFTNIPITDIQKIIKTDKIQLIQYNTVCPKVTISPQSLRMEVYIPPQVKVLTMYKLISTYCKYVG